MTRRKIIQRGWTVFVLSCADGNYFTGMARDLKRFLTEMTVLRTGTHVSKHPEMFPVKLVFREDLLPFREAYAKRCYLREMNKRMKTKLVKTKRWPIGGALLDYIKTCPIEELE